MGSESGTEIFQLSKHRGRERNAIQFLSKRDARGSLGRGLRSRGRFTFLGTGQNLLRLGRRVFRAEPASLSRTGMGLFTTSADVWRWRARGAQALLVDFAIGFSGPAEKLEAERPERGKQNERHDNR
jgi:hypothetical protein